jgi:hypothetical protein
MIYIWILIIAGVIIVPVISGAVKELEKKLEKQEVDQKSTSKSKKNQKVEDTKFAIKSLTYLVVIIFIGIVLIMARFIGQIIYAD